MTYFNLVVNIEVAEEKGEDANLAEHFGQTFLMGVFDGLGGRSAGYDGKTGGRIASEVASQISKTFFIKQWYGNITPENVILLQQEICQSLKIKADTNMPRTSSRLKGSLVEHKLCTTIALASIPKQQGQEKIFEVNLAWMGDSRIYFLSPTKGLQQLTKDDLVTPKDALEMLRQDPPMSQYLTADINPRWQIHFQHYKIEEIGCFLACTDGCFQYVSAPWEFEKLLLDTLYQSTGDRMDTNNWQKLICQKYTDIKQDDISLILYPVGFNGIKHLKSTYQQRWQHLQENFISPTANTRYDDLQRLWSKYRIDYEHYFSSIQDIQQTTNYKSPNSENHSSSLVTSTSSSLSTNTFQEITQSSKQKAAAKAEKIKNLLRNANYYYQKNQLKEAEDSCVRVLEIDPYQSESKYILGLIYTKTALYEIDSSRKEKWFKKAASYLEEIRKDRAEKLIESLQTLCFIYYHLEQWDKAVYSYQECFKCPGAEKLDHWEEDLETFITSLRLILNRDEAANIAIQFCQRLDSNLPYAKNAYPYYFIAVLQEIKGELNAAWNSIQTAVEIYNRSSHPMEIKYESLQKARQKYQEIMNKLKSRGYY
ncbi:hypothetical protein [Argonema antarcticum]|uniref:hypothetical protein n=1 Tax=Argonema antarcticum TaxID=2942763 RepID=UPI00201351EE|nr:hypothetical protein [Argonema antarcticum]MCL1471230.1 hypothetical protein [Argonema antarcticum A004/B2]